MKTVAYWLTTGLLSLGILASGIAHSLHVEPMVEGITQGMGYPEYFMSIVGTWKLLAVPALLVPRAPRLKEWAYAGLFFLLSGAAISHFAAGDAANAPGSIVMLVLCVASWALRPESRKLAPGDT